MKTKEQYRAELFLHWSRSGVDRFEHDDAFDMRLDAGFDAAWEARDAEVNRMKSGLEEFQKSLNVKSNEVAALKEELNTLSLAYENAVRIAVDREYEIKSLKDEVDSRNKIHKMLNDEITRLESQLAKIVKAGNALATFTDECAIGATEEWCSTIAELDTE